MRVNKTLSVLPENTESWPAQGIFWLSAPWQIFDHSTEYLDAQEEEPKIVRLGGGEGVLLPRNFGDSF